MAIGDDFSISSTGDIRHTSGTTNYTVIQFHRWLGDLMDDAQASGNDILDITDATASERATDNYVTLINGYNIDDTAAQFLYDGSIVQAGGAEIYDGLVVIAAAGTELEVIQNGAKLTNFWGTSYNPDAANGISHRFMVKVRTGGADIDGRRLLTQTRGWGKTFSEFAINGTARGNNVAALTYATDLNNATAIGTIAAIADITNLTEGYKLMDVDGIGGNEAYYSEWDRGANSINTFYERMKWLTRAGSSSTLYGLNGELFRGITHEINIDGGSGTWNAFEAVSWTGGTGQMLAINNTTATSATKMWIQLLTGVAPTDNQLITGGGSGATNTVNVTVTPRTLSYPFVGQSTGSAIIGGYGVGIQTTDLTANDKVFDLTNTQITPPNNVTFSVAGLVIGEDRVLVGPESGGTLNTSQFSLNTTLSGAAETAVVVGSAIPSDTPATGTIRVELNSGIYRRLVYTSWTGSTFTIGSTSFAADNATAGNDVYISYIDKLADATTESFSVVYNGPRPLYIRVRDGAASPIKTFETTGSIGAAGGSATAIRTPDV